ncbi:amidase [Nesterenkonia jeotgali]|uniref:Amidase n=1 Tax=Nesterenkonia jeotgali TaxID=317018 RepID=A0A0W8IKE4_9MICC|nr:amidase [Nesterenkonia jeotgali]KUG60316.1 amidase [Nesterenkonia jeotgali]MBA8920185.1 amidase [Nesterenkonia jeotgali]
MSATTFDVVEATIPELRAALEGGEVTSEALVQAYLDRIEAYDQRASRHGPALGSVVVLNPRALEEARASDARRAAGEPLGSLEGIPYTAKDSYKAEGLTVAAGSPAFAELVAGQDSFVVGRLRGAGAILLGLTNMPPLANGGMQRGLYGRAESPYNSEYLTSAFASGSSNGSGTATAASFASFGLAEETWSSGRAPASNNALCAYTPSWGVISMRGNWPLVPTMDVVVPHTRSMTDMLEVLEVVVADDPHPRGDFWRVQPWHRLPPTSALRPASYTSLGAPDEETAREVLTGVSIGVPRMYLGEDPEAGTRGPGPSGITGIGGSTGRPVSPRASVLTLWETAAESLRAAGARLTRSDLPVVSNYEGDRPDAPRITTRGLVPPEYLRQEVGLLSAWACEDFLAANADPALHSMVRVDGAQIFPAPPGALPDRYDGFEDDIATLPELVREHPNLRLETLPLMREGIEGLLRTRELDFEQWMDQHGFDLIAFPAVADVGPADADTSEASAELAWRNGVWVANGNLVWRHLGIPTVTVPMGTMADTSMPVGLTFAGRAHDDTRLLQIAAAFEATGRRRTEPPLTPRL